MGDVRAADTEQRIELILRRCEANQPVLRLDVEWLLAERARHREALQLLDEWANADPYSHDWVDFEERVRAALSAGEGEQPQ